jgi:hypothetical protein
VIDHVTGIELVPFSVIEGVREAPAAPEHFARAPLTEMCGGGVWVTRSLW